MNSIPGKITKGRWPLCCLLFFVMACFTKRDYDASIPAKRSLPAEEEKITAALNSIYSCKKMVEPGDLIMRTGSDFMSETIRLLSTKDQTYSHCGIASIENDSVFVYHAIGGEWNPDQKLRRDPFEIFCNPFENRGFGIFRYKLSRQQDTALVGLARGYYKQGLMFDTKFDLASNDRMYCSEFVYKAVENASDHKIVLPATIINHIKFVATDNLFINPDCNEIKRIIFNRE
jgi:hypothetical protein